MADARTSLQSLSRGALGREPQRRVQEERQRLDHLEESLHRAAKDALQLLRHRLDEKSCGVRLAGPQHSLELRAQIVRSLREKMDDLLCCQRERLQARLRASENLLRVLGPQATLERGYSITVNAAGEIIRTVTAATRGEQLVTRLRDGEILSEVLEVRSHKE